MFIARTISRTSLLAAAARLVPNDHHAKALERLQPGREQRDVFRTAYKMNTRRDLARLLDRGLRVGAGPPHGSRAVLQALAPSAPRRGEGERHLPTSMWMALVVFARRKA